MEVEERKKLGDVKSLYLTKINYIVLPQSLHFPRRTAEEADEGSAVFTTMRTSTFRVV